MINTPVKNDINKNVLSHSQKTDIGSIKSVWIQSVKINHNLPCMLYGKQRNAAIRWDIVTTVNAECLDLKAPKSHTVSSNLSTHFVAFCDLSMPCDKSH